MLESQYYTEKTGIIFGGYAKHKPRTDSEFMRRLLWLKTNIKTDPIYTGKLFYALVDLVKKDYFKEGSTIVVVHTGGLQGVEGFENRHGFSIFR